MSLIIRIDVDSPYGRKTFFKRLLSRTSSEIYFPKLEILGYLADLKNVITLLNRQNVRAYLFFRKCTLPKATILELINAGKYEIGLHLENSRSFNTFINELEYFKKYFKRQITAFTKHGSGKYRYGFMHYAPYEPKKYIEWGKKSGMKLFLGNDEDPTVPYYDDDSLLVFPSAFWLEPYWRNTQKYSLSWLIQQANVRDIVLLFHPTNIMKDKYLYNDLQILINEIPSKIFFSSEKFHA